MITYDYKYTEIELTYADFTTDEVRSITLEIKGHKKTRNKKLIQKQLEAHNIKALDYKIKNIAFKERQYKMHEDTFIQLAQPSLY